jgi:signal peptidase II
MGGLLLKRLRLDNWILPVTAALVLLTDQLGKYFVTAWLKEGQSRHVAPWLAPIFRITHVTNTGAAFGLFPKWGDFFVVVAALVIVVIIIYYRYLPDGHSLARVALGLQLGGALGNLVDRLRQGFVVDFIDLNFWPLHNWPVFNLADSSVVAGVTLLALLMVWEERRGQGEVRVARGG